MIPAFTVWQWDEYNGWQLFLGSNASGTADQVRRALALYQPQKWYQTFPRQYSLAPAFDVIGQSGGNHYNWGATPGPEATWICIYALSRLLRPGVLITARPYPGHKLDEVTSAMPSFAQTEVAQRYRYG